MELQFSIPGYCYLDITDKDTIIHLDLYSASMELDIYCKCGKHFVSYKEAGEDCFLMRCPKCQTHYKIHQKMTVIESFPSEAGEVILPNDDIDLGAWK